MGRTGLGPVAVLAATLFVEAFGSAHHHHYVRGAASRHVPGNAESSWGAHDEAVLTNPWAPIPKIPGLHDLYPVAPTERLSNSWGNLLTGASPASPSEGVEKAYRSEEISRQLPPDGVPPYSRPFTFPDESGQTFKEEDSPMVPLTEKRWIGKADKLRAHFGTGGEWDPSSNYPLQAPMDALPSGPHHVAQEDKVPQEFARYFHQVHDGHEAGEAAQRVDEVFVRTDKNRDNMISYKEYSQETEGRQNKSAIESEKLWSKYHTSKYVDMTRNDFERLVRAGFDLGGINRKDVTSEMTAEGGIQGRGFWGSGASCPEGAYVTAVRLKVAPFSDNRDNSGLNRIALRCDPGGVEKESAEGPDGEWTDWAECPSGQRVFSVRVRSDRYTTGQDNTGINDVEVGCREPDLSKFSSLRFGDDVKKKPGRVVAKGPVAVGGGWSQTMRCPPSAALCGVRANVVRDQGTLPGGDDLGIANLKFYCCAAPVDCAKVCTKKLLASGSIGRLRCRVCRQAAGAR